MHPARLLQPIESASTDRPHPGGSFLEPCLASGASPVGGVVETMPATNFFRTVPATVAAALLALLTVAPVTGEVAVPAVTCMPFVGVGGVDARADLADGCGTNGAGTFANAVDDCADTGYWIVTLSYGSGSGSAKV